RAAIDETGSLARLRDDMEKRILARQPDAVVISQTSARLPNTSCIATPGVKAATQVMGLDLAGVAVSAGSACSSGKVQTSHVLDAMGYGPGIADCAIRVSLGRETTSRDIDAFVEPWDQIITRTTKSRPLKERVNNA
ncbi:MAG: aminotransferase class V-fold PLP-dependent enzyme, partial [Alphaproteobacteria bacterium]|nr:aminotransferase class V-fold PLP-dependent enzyme [Alphaproteobacteria bacterium]